MKMTTPRLVLFKETVYVHALIYCDSGIRKEWAGRFYCLPQGARLCLMSSWACIRKP